MSFYDINYDQQVIDLMPPDKRGNGLISLLQAFLSSIQWARDLILGSYKLGAPYLNWAPGTYNLYDQIIYKKAVYMSLIANNTDIPTVVTSWLLVQANFLGVDVRIKFNCQKIVLEYALNSRFGGVFRNPPSASHSDIYITNLPPVPYGFRVGNSVGSDVGDSTSSDTVGSPYPFVRTTGYQINFLGSLFSLTSQQEVRDFVNLYNAFGINYSVVPY